MKKSNVILVAACLLLWAVCGLAENPPACSESQVTVTVGTYEVTGWVCDQPDAQCYPAECGASGRCVTVAYTDGGSDCFCHQDNLPGIPYQSAGGQAFVDVTPSDIVPEAGQSFLFAFDVSGALDEIVFIGGDEAGTELGRVPGPFVGSFEINFHSASGDHVYGSLENFHLGVDQYFSPCGWEASGNSWDGLPGASYDVTYDSVVGTITTDAPMTMVYSAMITGEPAFQTTSWMSLYIGIREGTVPEEKAVWRMSEAHAIPDCPIFHDDHSWGAVKALYR